MFCCRVVIGGGDPPWLGARLLESWGFCEKNISAFHVHCLLSLVDIFLVGIFAFPWQSK